MRILAACSLGGAGHWIPLSGVLDAAAQRGDDVLVAGPPALGDMVRGHGFSFTAGGEPPEAVIAPLRDRLAVASPADASVIGNRDLFPSPFPTTLRFRGPNRPALRSLPDWWEGASAPLVYATLGTVLPHMSAALDHYRLLIDALADIDARVLLTIGRHIEPSSLGSVPDHVRVEQWVDQIEVFPDAALTVCHGGSGTLFGSLAAGVPVLVLPSFADQFANADLVEHHRLGRVVRPESHGDERRPLRSTDRDRITTAITTTLSDDETARRCASIARQFAQAPEATTALDLAFADA